MLNIILMKKGYTKMNINWIAVAAGFGMGMLFHYMDKLKHKKGK